VSEEVKEEESGPALEDVDGRLLWLLRKASDEWGVSGVARVAALLAGQASEAFELVRVDEVLDDLHAHADGNPGYGCWDLYDSWARKLGRPERAVQWTEE
jgi:hypothetical protein